MLWNVQKVLAAAPAPFPQTIQTQGMNSISRAKSFISPKSRGLHLSYFPSLPGVEDWAPQEQGSASFLLMFTLGGDNPQPLMCPSVLTGVWGS